MAKDHLRVDQEPVQQMLLDDPGFLKEIVERVLRQLLEAEMTEHLRAAPYERTQTRRGHRNGHKPRTLKTRVGTLELCSSLRTGRALSQPGFSPATKGTRRLRSWP